MPVADFRHEKPHAANLFDFQAKYAEVISEAEAIAVIAACAPARLKSEPGGAIRVRAASNSALISSP